MVTTKPTQKQIRGLWEWCGFRRNPYNYSGEKEYWFDPDGETRAKLPFLNLCSLFEYAVPKAREEVGADELARRMAGWISDVVLVGINPEDSLFRLLDNIRSGGRG